MPFAIYGKRTEILPGMEKPDATFRALNYKGIRVSTLADAGTFATKKDAQEHLDKHTGRSPKRGTMFEIRSIK